MGQCFGFGRDVVGCSGLVIVFKNRTACQKHLKFYLSGTVKYASYCRNDNWRAAIIAFIVMNASLGVIVSGGFRGTTIQVGTGKYFFLAYLLISGGFF